MTRTLTADQLIDQIAERLRQNQSCAFIAEIANQVLGPYVSYDGDSTFTQEVE